MLSQRVFGVEPEGRVKRMDSRVHGNDRNPAHRLVSFPQRRESIFSPRESYRIPANFYAANPRKVKPFIRREQGVRRTLSMKFTLHKKGPEFASPALSASDV